MPLKREIAWPALKGAALAVIALVLRGFTLDDWPLALGFVVLCSAFLVSADAWGRWWNRRHPAP
jgi:hypothetical protein